MATALIVQCPSDERTRLSMAVRVAGHDPVEVSSGRAAVDGLSDLKPDVVVIDEDLPDTHATEAVLLLRAVSGFESLPAVVVLPPCAADENPIETETPMPSVPGVYWACKPISSLSIGAAIQHALDDAGGSRHVKLEQRRSLWHDVSTLQTQARAAT
ncbi:MAG: hypothetical protein ACXVQV_08350 [Actinomycetota bacterium]